MGTLLSDNQIAFLFSSVKHERVTRLAAFLETNHINVYSPRSDAGSEIMTTHILAYLDGMASTISYADHMQQGTLSMVAETSAPYGSDK